MYDTVLLDLDLTIFDFEASERAAFGDCLAHLGVGDRFDEMFPRYYEINSALWKAVERGELSPSQAGLRRFDTLIAEFGLAKADPVQLDELFQNGLGTHGGLYPGTEPVLDELAARVSLALVTNGLSRVQRAKIQRLNLDRWFPTIVISDEVGVAKPNPAIFQLVFDRMGNPDRDRTVMVGDSLSSDMAGGRAAGIITCWLVDDPSLGQGAQPDVDHHVAHLGQVLELLD